MANNMRPLVDPKMRNPNPEILLFQTTKEWSKTSFYECKKKKKTFFKIFHF